MIRCSLLLLSLTLAGCAACDKPRTRVPLKLTNLPECNLRTEKGLYTEDTLPEQIKFRVEYGGDTLDFLASDRSLTLPSNWAGKKVMLRAGVCRIPCDARGWTTAVETVIGGDQNGFVLALPKLERRCPDGTLATVK